MSSARDGRAPRHPSRATAAEARRRGADAFLVKPVAPARLRRAVRAQLAGR